MLRDTRVGLDELRFVGRFHGVELRLRAEQGQVSRTWVEKAHRHEATAVAGQPGLDHEVRQRLRQRVDHEPKYVGPHTSCWAELTSAPRTRASS